MYTSASRREFYTKDGGIEPFMPHCQWGYTQDTKDGREIQNNLTMIQNSNEDFMNWYKNHLLIKHFLESKKTNWIWNGWFGIPPKYEEFNRFDGEYGGFFDRGVDGIHPGPQHNLNYANRLKKHIIENFRNYIPTSLI
jgi:hypothetical protein